MARGAEKAETDKSYFLPMGIGSKEMDRWRKEKVGVNAARAGTTSTPPAPSYPGPGTAHQGP